MIFGETLTPMAEVLKIAAQSVTALAERFHELPVPMRLFLQMILGGTMAMGASILVLGQLRRLQASLPGIISAATGAMKAQNSTLRSGNVLAGRSAARMLKLNLAMSVFSVAALQMTAALVVFKLLDEKFGYVDKATDMMKEFGYSVLAVGSALENDFETYTVTRRHLIVMAKVLGHSSLAWLEHAKHTEENAKKMVEVREELFKLNRERVIEADRLRNLDALGKHRLEFLSDEHQLIRARLLQQAELNKEIREEYDLMTSGEVLASLDSLAEKSKNAVSQGIPLTRIWKEMKGDIEDTLVRQNEYNIAAPKWVRNLADELKKTGDAGLDSYIKKLDKDLPQHMDTTGGKIIEGMITVGGEIAKTLSGGFSKGFEDGVNEFTAYDLQLQNALNASLKGGFGMGFSSARTEYDEFTRDIREHPIEVKIEINTDSLIDTLNDWADGKFPDTGG